MPLTLSEQLLYSTVKLIVTKGDGATSSGTAFFFQLPASEGDIPVLVTNKHVIEGGVAARFFVHRAINQEPISGPGHEIQMGSDFLDHWLLHPDHSIDLAVMPATPLLEMALPDGEQVFAAILGKTFLPGDKDVEAFVAIEDITMVGYPIGLADSVNNLPLVRRGTTATHPAKDYEGRSELMIDCACFPGSSGSPVFLYNPMGFTDRSGKFFVSSRIFLLGVLWGGPQFTAEGELVVKAVPTSLPGVHSRIPTNLGYVIKWGRLLDFVPALSQ